MLLKKGAVSRLLMKMAYRRGKRNLSRQRSDSEDDEDDMFDMELQEALILSVASDKKNYDYDSENYEFTDEYYRL